jgi:hypothetical protein
MDNAGGYDGLRDNSVQAENTHRYKSQGMRANDDAKSRHIVVDELKSTFSHSTNQTGFYSNNRSRMNQSSYGAGGGG